MLDRIGSIGYLNVVSEGLMVGSKFKNVGERNCFLDGDLVDYILVGVGIDLCFVELFMLDVGTYVGVIFITCVL